MGLRKIMYSLRNVQLPKKIQLFFIGDSITLGVGTNTTGSSASGQYNGGDDYPNKTVAQLSGLTIAPVIRGFPGQTASWYYANDLNRTISLFDHDNYTDVYCVVFFGANDLVLISPTDFETNITATCNALKSAGAKIIMVPVLPRKDGSINNNTARGTYNTWLSANYTSFADSLVDFSGHPEFFGDNAPDDATYYAAPDADGSSKVHPTNTGALIIANQLATNISSLVLSSSLPYTPLDYAGNFISAAGITDSTQISALRTMVTALVTTKPDGNRSLWHSLEAIYPFVGGTATAHKFNLKDPRDLDDAHRLVYSGTPTHNSNGITWDTNSYADTKLQDTSAPLTYINRSLHYYSRSVPSTQGIDMGYYTSGRASWLGIKFNGSSYSAVSADSDAGTGETYTGIGFYSTSRNNSPTSKSLYNNGVLVRTVTSAFRQPTPINLFLGGSNTQGFLQYPSNRNCAYAAIGYGLSATEEAAHYDIVQAFQTALGRAV